MLVSPIFLAIQAAFVFAVVDSTIRFALRNSTAYTGSVVQAVTHLIIFGALALWLQPAQIWLNRGTWWFLASGVADPGIGLIFFFIGISRVGVSRASSILSTGPLFSTAGAILLLGERPNAGLWLGALAIIAGVCLLAYEPGVAVRRKSGYVYAILGAVFLGLAHPLRKLGLQTIPSTFVGITIAQVGALITLALVAPLLPAGSRFKKNPRALALFLLASVGVGMAYYLLFEALQRGSVSLVIPLMHTSPLFVILLAWLLFREKEQINLRLILGAVIIILGAAAIIGLGE